MLSGGVNDRVVKGRVNDGVVVMLSGILPVAALSGRNCHAVYHVIYVVPNSAGVCMLCFSSTSRVLSPV